MSRQKAKGSAWERAVRDWIREHLDGRAYKPHEEGFEDVGDLHALGGSVVVQAKDWRSWEDAMREGLDGAVRQAAAWDRKTAPRLSEDDPAFRESMRRDPALPVAVVKRARKPVGEAYAVLRLSDLARLLRRAYGP